MGSTAIPGIRVGDILPPFADDETGWIVVENPSVRYADTGPSGPKATVARLSSPTDWRWIGDYNIVQHYPPTRRATLEECVAAGIPYTEALPVGDDAPWSSFARRR